MIRKGYVDAFPSGQIHYRRADPAPACDVRGSALLLHQRPSSSRMWEPILPILAKQGFQAIALDLPGHGESLQLQDYTLPILTKHIAESIPQLSLSTPRIVVGHHLGAAVAMQLAVDFPDTMSRLALWGIPIIDEQTKKLIPAAPDLDDEELKDVIRFWKIRPRYYTTPIEMPKQIRIARLTELLQSDPKAADLVMSMDVETLVRKISHPTLCMYGESEMLKDATIRAAEEMRCGEVCCVANAGVDVQDEYAHEFTEAIVEFLTREFPCMQRECSGN